MLEAKRRRLEAQGWRVGSVTEFLGLGPEEERYIELKLLLAEGLRRRRERQQLTRADAARLIRASPAQVAKMEEGDPSVSIDLLIRALLALGTSPGEMAELIGDKRVERPA